MLILLIQLRFYSALGIENAILSFKGTLIQIGKSTDTFSFT